MLTIPLEAKFNWGKVDPVDLAATASKSAPGADLEILFSHHRMHANSFATSTEHHNQAKVYTPKGVERSSVFAVEHEKSRQLSEVRARVVKPDGSFVELTKAEFHETTSVRSGGFELLRTTFSFPNVQPGDILEYRWDEQIDDSTGYYIQFCQAAEVPTREFEFEIDGAKSDFVLSWYNCPTAVRDPKLRKVTIRNLPPFITEPLIPTETEFRSWLMIQFTSPDMRWYSKDDAWREIGEYFAEEFRLDTVPTPALRTKAAQLTAQFTTPEQKLAALYDFTRTAVRSLDFYEGPELAAAKKKRLEEDKFQTPAKTLERGSGFKGDINRLFAALARAAGFEVRMAMSANRTRVLNMKGDRGWMFADRYSVAVKIGSEWRFYTPGEPLLAPGLLDVKDEGATAFVCDEKKSWFQSTQVGLPPQTQLKRQGRFELDAEGTLDGEVTVEMTGHRAVGARDNGWNWSIEERTKSIRESLVHRLATAEVSNVRCDTARDLLVPLVVKYHVHVPGYADSIGSRLAIPVNFFEANAAETFTNETRRYPIFFDFAEETHDDIQIVFPEGFVLDGASAPGSVGTPEDIFSARYGLTYLGKSRTLTFQREKVIGRKGMLSFQAESYPALREIFERIHRSDAHQLVIKPKTAVASVTPAATAPVAP
ncbi:MAG: DUF3857 domain-containing protein [Opitutus sp.]